MMTNKAFLRKYRDTLLELRVMERQLELSGTTGRPASSSTFRYDGMPRGTNDKTAAAIQQQEGIEAAVRSLREEMAHMQTHYEELLRKARNFRDRCILRQYYQLCQTDAQIAECLCVSTRHANRLRAELLAHLDNTSSMSIPVVACPHTP